MHMSTNGLRRKVYGEKKTQVELLKKELPVYPIGVAAKLLNLHPRTLRIYEDEGLIKPERVGNRKLYSANDITWVGCLRKMIHDDGISIPGIKKLLRFATCYEIAGCPDQIHCNCDAVIDRTIPRKLHLAGDSAVENEAMKEESQDRKQKRKALKEQGSKGSKDRDQKVE